MKIIENIIPILPVGSLKDTIEFYEKKLSFTQDWLSEPLAQVSRDGYSLMFRESDKITEQEIWIGTEELDELFQSFLNSEIVIEQFPKNNAWAYDCKIRDLNGHILWFGTEPKL